MRKPRLATLSAETPSFSRSAAASAEMLVEIDDALLQPAPHPRTGGVTSILMQTRLLAHAGVLEDRLQGLDQQHQHVRRGDDHARPVGLLDDILEALIEIGIDRLPRART